MSDESKTTDQQEKPYDDLVAGLKDKLDFYFSSQIVSLFKTADESLFDAANSATSMDEQNRMFELMNALRAEKETIEKNFISELSLFIRPISEVGGAPRKKEESDEDNQLGLIEQDDMDEMVALSTISGKADSDCREELSHLEARLGHLAQQNNSIFPPKALQPRNLCDAFKEAIEVCDFDIRNKLVFYKLFNRELILPLKKLYKELNETMIEAGILPQIDLSGKVKRPPKAPLPEDNYFDEEAQSDGAPTRQGGGSRSAGGMSGPGGSAGMAGGGAGPGGAGGSAGMAGGGVGPGGAGGSAGMAGGGTGPGGAGGSAGMASGGTGPGGAGGSAGMSGGGAGPGGAGGSTGIAGAGGTAGHAGGSGSASTAESGDAGGGGYTAGLPVSQVRESISSYVGGEPTRSDDAVSGRGGGGGYYTHNDVVSALSSLQSEAPMVAPGAKLEFNAAAIKKAVLTSIGEKHGGVVDKRVNHVSEKTIDFIKLIFDAIIADNSITDAIKTLLLSLQIPVIKAAMIDANFFVDDFHPARQLLDKLAEAGVGVSDHKDLIYIGIEKIVRKLLNDYDEDVTAFKLALEELHKLTGALTSKAQEREALAQRQLKHALARNVVLQEIRKITLGHELHVGVHELVLRVWPSLMFNHFLNFGKANDEWVEMLMILDKLIESVQPLTNTAELKTLGLGYEDIISAVGIKLRLSKRTETQIKEILDGLRATYLELMATSDLPDVEQVHEEPVAEVAGSEPAKAQAKVAAVTDKKPEIEQAPEAEIENETPEKIAQRKVETLPEDVKPGAWFIVYNGDDKPVRRLKLAVILIQTATLMFVDHLGNIVIEKDAEEFTEELKQDLSGIIMQHSVFDHALNSALRSINQ